MSRAEIKDGLCADFEQLYKHGSGGKTIAKCATVLSLGAVKLAIEARIEPTDAAMTLLDMVAERGVERQQRYVRCGAAITGIQPRSVGPGIKGAPYNNQRRKAAGNEDYDAADAGKNQRGVSATTAGRKRESDYYPAYADAILDFEKDVRRDKDLLIAFLRRCGAMEDVISRIVEQEPAGVSAGQSLAMNMSTQDAAHSAVVTETLSPSPTDALDGIGSAYQQEPLPAGEADAPPRANRLHSLAQNFQAVLKRTSFDLRLVFSLLIMSAASLLSPASAWGPISVVDKVLTWDLSVNLLFIWLSWVVWVVTTGKGYPGRRLQAGIISGILVISLANWLLHFIRYDYETRDARWIRSQARIGGAVAINEFDQSAPCPNEPTDPSPPVIPFSSCSLNNGVLHGNLKTFSPGQVVGTLQVDHGRIDTIALHSEGSRSTYYIETAFRAGRDTHVPACGLTIEGNVEPRKGTKDAYEKAYPALFIHLKDTSASNAGVYAVEIVGTYLDPRYRTLFTTNRQFIMGRAGLPFINNLSFPGWGDGSWTKLGTLLNGNQLLIFVNGRLSLSFTYPGLNEIRRLGLGIETGTMHSGGIAACDFDYVRVRSLPEND